ncbi:MAG: glycosyltransferase family 4 protein [Gemmatimonadetes bacterium]|nr:glycosyltransferase family 4 protein [Gemmatimonadota bacterium]
MRLDHVGVVHFPFGTMIPEVRSVPTATTIHDMQHEAFPELFSRPELAYRRLVYRRTAQRSTAIIAVSEHAARSISTHLDVPLDRIRVIHQGVDLDAFTPGSESREPYLLYPANPWPHKNHHRLFEAFAILRSRTPDLRLVLTGTGHDPALLPSGVETRGRVSTAELVALYQRAAALVFPSLYEGFGIPPLEAMATGCPVAASGTSAIPEIVGDAAVLFDPMDPEAIADGVETLLANPEPFVERGYARARSFSWAETAARHVALYRELSA